MQPKPKKQTGKAGMSPAEWEKQHAERMEMVTHIEGDLPYNREVYINEVKLFVRRTVEDILEAGKRLLVIKEKEGYGAFVQICEEEIGIPHSSAYRFMNAALGAGQFPAIKFEDFSHVGKVYTLLEAPAEDLKRLEEEGVLAGKTVDELQTMSVKEMRDLIKSLKTGMDKLVKKEAGDLKEENRHLKKTIVDLQKLLPAPGASYGEHWADTHLSHIEGLFEQLDNYISSLAFDSRITTDDVVQARVEGFYTRTEGLLIRFARRWEKESGLKVTK